MTSPVGTALPHYRWSGSASPTSLSRERTARLVSWHDLPVSSETTRACRLPFTGIVRRFRGGWFESCRIYREWVRTQPYYQAASRRPR